MELEDISLETRYVEYYKLKDGCRKLLKIIDMHFAQKYGIKLKIDI